MNSDSPYQTPSVQPPQMPPPSLASSKPTVVTVFAVIHLVAAAFGVFGIATILAQPLMMKALSNGNPQLQAQMKAQAEYQWWIYTSAGLSAILIVLMIPAAIKMLKGRKDGLAWSNAYAYASIVVKVIGVTVTVSIVAPAIRAAMVNINSPTPAFFMGTAWYLICGCLPMLYPLLALVLLNTPRVKG